MADADVTAKINEIWHGIEDWYRENAPRLYADLKPGASDEQLSALEGHIGVSLPADYRASLQVHNGDVNLHDYRYLNVDGVLHDWSTMSQLNDNGTFKGRVVDQEGGGIIQNTWWHRSWIPFAEDSGGNMICIDMAPGPKGSVGQVILMEMGSGPGATPSKSFLEWLGNYWQDLHRGKYEVDEDGFLLEKA